MVLIVGMHWNARLYVECQQIYRITGSRTHIIGNFDCNTETKKRIEFGQRMAALYLARIISLRVMKEQTLKAAASHLTISVQSSPCLGHELKDSFRVNRQSCRVQTVTRA